MNAPLDIKRRPSVCPHDCPSVCALDVEVLGENRIGRVHGAADHPYTQGVVCAKVARYAERIHHPDRLTRPLMRVGPKGSGQFAPDLLGRGARPRRRSVPQGRAGAWRRKRLALLLCRHHGPRDARRDQPFNARQALFPLPWHHLRRHRLAGLYRRNGAHVGDFACRNGEVRCRRDLGNQRRLDPGQPHDARDARAEGPRSEDRRDRHLSDRDDAAGGPCAAAQARHGRRARVRRHARALPRRPRRPRLHGALHGRAGCSRGPSSRSFAAMGKRDHWAERRRDRGLRGARRPQQAHLLPPRLRLLAPAQRRGEHARGALHSRGHGRLGARGRRRAACLERGLWPRPDPDRRPR